MGMGDGMGGQREGGHRNKKERGVLKPQPTPIPSLSENENGLLVMLKCGVKHPSGP